MLSERAYLLSPAAPQHGVPHSGSGQYMRFRRLVLADCTPAGTVHWYTPGWSKTTLVVGGSASAIPPPRPPSAAQTDVPTASVAADQHPTR
jgi:hypothetical protein